MDNLTDSAGGANLFGGGNYSFVENRYCVANKAIYFNHGYLQIPSGIYFSGDFTITAWIYLKSYVDWQNIFYFGNESTNNDSIIFQMYSNTSRIGLTVYDLMSQNDFYAQSSETNYIGLNKWNYVQIYLGYNGGQAVIYNNCAYLGMSYFPMPHNVTRTTNFIGKTASSSDPNLYANAIYDDIKIYQGQIDVSADCGFSGPTGYEVDSCPTTTTISTTTTTTTTTDYINNGIVIIPGYDIPSNNLVNSETTDGYDKCAITCQNTAQCTHFTWYNTNSALFTGKNYTQYCATKYGNAPIANAVYSPDVAPVVAGILVIIIIIIFLITYSIYNLKRITQLLVVHMIYVQFQLDHFLKMVIILNLSMFYFI